MPTIDALPPTPDLCGDSDDKTRLAGELRVQRNSDLGQLSPRVFSGEGFRAKNNRDDCFVSLNCDAQRSPRSAFSLPTSQLQSAMQPRECNSTRTRNHGESSFLDSHYTKQTSTFASCVLNRNFDCQIRDACGASAQARSGAAVGAPTSAVARRAGRAGRGGATRRQARARRRGDVRRDASNADEASRGGEQQGLGRAARRRGAPSNAGDRAQPARLHVRHQCTKARSAMRADCPRSELRA